MQTRQWWWPIGSVMALVLGVWTDARAANGQDWGPWGMHMMWGSWGIGMMIMMFLFWSALIVGIIVLIRWLLTTGSSGHHAATGPHAESPLDILKKRYARGEISKQEFDDMRRDLQ